MKICRIYKIQGSKKDFKKLSIFLEKRNCKVEELACDINVENTADDSEATEYTYKLYSVAEYADKIGKSKQTVYKLIKNNEVKAIKYSSGRWVIYD